MPTDQECPFSLAHPQWQRIMARIPERWSVYGLAVSVPTGWSLDKHQLMLATPCSSSAGGSRHPRRAMGACQRGLKDVELRDFVWQKSRKFWKDFSIDVTEAAVTAHGQSLRRTHPAKYGYAESRRYAGCCGALRPIGSPPRHGTATRRTRFLLSTPSIPGATWRCSIRRWIR